jgi:hypothetical protein
MEPTPAIARHEAINRDDRPASGAGRLNYVPSRPV